MGWIIYVFDHPLVVPKSEMPRFIHVEMENEGEDLLLGSFQVFYGLYQQSVNFNRNSREISCRLKCTVRPM